jgi:hypothetical protein
VAIDRAEIGSWEDKAECARSMELDFSDPLLVETPSRVALLVSGDEGLTSCEEVVALVLLRPVFELDGGKCLDACAAAITCTEASDVKSDVVVADCLA